MKLDRNLNADGHGKYGLILNRRLAAIKNEAPPQYVAAIESAIKVLEGAGIIDWVDTVDTEVFVVRLRDICAAPALRAYAVAAHDSADAEYAREVFDLASRSGIYHPNPKVPD